MRCGSRGAGEQGSRGAREQGSQTISPAPTRSGVVLIAVLVVVVLLSLAAYQYGEVMTNEYKAADAAARAAQARALAWSGVHYAAALLANPDSMTGTLGGNPYDNPSVFQNIAVGDFDNPRWRGRFSIVSPLGEDDVVGGTQSFRYGVVDEAGKVNLNALIKIDPSGQVAHDLLMKLPNMTEDVADAIIDWIDPDDEPRANGAESQYYTGLSPGYRCKNGPLDSLEELLLVRGVTPELLLGTDRNRNGIADPDEGDDGMGNGTLADRGWSAYLTVYSRERNVDSTGNPRININDSDLTTLYQSLSDALGAPLADFIMAYRYYGAYTPQPAQPGQNVQVINSGAPVTQAQWSAAQSQNRQPQAIPSLFALVSARVGISRQAVTVTTVTTTTQGGRGGTTQNSRTTTSTQTITTVYNSPLADQSNLATLLPTLLDKCTTRADTELPARVNINVAPSTLLATLPGLEDTDVQAILNSRPQPGTIDPSDPTYSTVAWLMTQANLPASKLQALERYITASSQVYRVQSLGYFEQRGPTVRIEAVIDTNGGQPRIVYWRNLTELGKAFDIQKSN